MTFSQQHRRVSGVQSQGANDHGTDKCENGGGWESKAGNCTTEEYAGNRIPNTSRLCYGFVGVEKVRHWPDSNS